MATYHCTIKMEKPATLNAIANTFCAKAVMLMALKKKNLYISNSAICLTGLQNQLTFLRQQIYMNVKTEMPIKNLKLLCRLNFLWKKI